MQTSLRCDLYFLVFSLSSSQVMELCVCVCVSTDPHCEPAVEAQSRSYSPELQPGQALRYKHAQHFSDWCWYLGGAVYIITIINNINNNFTAKVYMNGENIAFTQNIAETELVRDVLHICAPAFKCVRLFFLSRAFCWVWMFHSWADSFSSLFLCSPLCWCLWNCFH